jgi:transcriptional regulator with XRE-family HTH domain
MKISTKAAIKRAGGTQDDLARLLGVTRQAISAAGRYLPELRAYKLKELKPHWIKPLIEATRAEDEALAAEQPSQEIETAQPNQ